MAIVTPYGFQYEHVAASQTAQVLGGTGAIGDLLNRLVITVNTSATSTVSIVDGATASHSVLPANSPIGSVVIELNALSVSGAWKITTGAGVEVMAIGVFSA